MSVPKDLFSMLEHKSTKETSICNNLSEADGTEVSFKKTIIYDRFDLPVTVRDVLFQVDCQNIRVSENQLGCLSDLETLEWFWNGSTSSGSSEDNLLSFSPQMIPRDDVSECETPVSSKPKSVKAYIERKKHIRTMFRLAREVSSVEPNGLVGIMNHGR